MAAIPAVELDWQTEEAPAVRPSLVPVPTPRRPRRLHRLPDRATRYRRRRLASLLVVCVAVAGVVGLVNVVVSSGAQSLPEPHEQSPITTPVYVVQPGDTLWSIAQRVAPGQDPRPIVAQLRNRNDVVDLEVGDRLVISD